ncbi:hypothetical protein Anapl_09201 [Anas platyrhynchos]|uniref:Uncharacterized protein n=1 Tax=Anas platyrhynchos TaxID=8839 RepID=R0L2P5_ANAPL|nr:hypothetical protein Anapl_09201 [Anas platyrhynchos]
MEPEQRVGGSPGTPAMLLVLSDGRAQRHDAVVPGLFGQRWIHFCGLGARGPLGTGVSCATGAIPSPTTPLLLLRCVTSWCFTRRHSCPHIKRPAAHLALLVSVLPHQLAVRGPRCSASGGPAAGGLCYRAHGQWWPLCPQQGSVMEWPTCGQRWLCWELPGRWRRVGRYVNNIKELADLDEGGQVPLATPNTATFGHARATPSQRLAETISEELSDTCYACCPTTIPTTFLVFRGCYDRYPSPFPNPYNDTEDGYKRLF